ncbi:hypothetical protein M409DRAFT_20567 [Zasmidium cellare ATCC 36951]|uniref:Uncharacterized protein n=1 Tax=Zasmidium cellare ATCC 36951 TaxID=1080233 RepID=A0A6A6CQB4_ZASCE|nr:uncharacterized protein M409DRAFT_20567 [Zasmidium cellare ATCC 36951]KAF2169344.1 hypothetical protein M409DRAFT_20567 [Zasmidium cellare ATCC 36951]
MGISMRDHPELEDLDDIWLFATDDSTLDESDSERETATDTSSNVPRRRPRKFSNTRSTLSPRVTISHVTDHFDQYGPSQANLHALVDQIKRWKHAANPGFRFLRLILIVAYILLSGSCCIKARAWDTVAYIVQVLVSLAVVSWHLNGRQLRWAKEELMFSLRPFSYERSSQRQNFKGLMKEILRYHQLEILCRYGDYLAERLKVLRQHILKSYSKEKHHVAGLWTDTSATLRHEEGKDSTICHDLIHKAAKDLKWDPAMTVFMIHTYGARNSLMHSEFPRLVSKKDWPKIAEHCDDDIVKLLELFIASNDTSEDAIGHWRQIIREFKDSWVRQVDASLSWEAQPIIQEALAVGIREPLLLYELSMKHRHDDAQARKQAVADLLKEQNAKEPSIKELQAEIERLKGTLAVGGTQKSTMDLLNQRNEEIKKLKRDTEKMQREMEKIKERLTTARKKPYISTAMANSKKEKRRRSWPTATATRTEVESLTSRLGTTASDVWTKCIGLELRNIKYVQDNKKLKNELEESQKRCEGLFSRFSAAQHILEARGVAASSEAARKMIDDEHKRMPRVTMRQATVSMSNNNEEPDGDGDENKKRPRSRSF